jgi:hypothetical protein
MARDLRDDITKRLDDLEESIPELPDQESQDTAREHWADARPRILTGDV